VRLPRDVSGQGLVSALPRLGYAPTRQSGSHVRLTTQERGEHHVTIPLHRSLRIGTLSFILRDVETHFDITRDALLSTLFGE
jgi:predicted RNA binding protein YcfA (HicA-like mRNA interferase family)